MLIDGAGEGGCMRLRLLLRRQARYLDSRRRVAIDETNLHGGLRRPYEDLSTRNIGLENNHAAIHALKP